MGSTSRTARTIWGKRQFGWPVFGGVYYQC